MEFESIRPFLYIILQTIGFVFLLEALVIYFFKIKTFWTALGVSVLINILSFVVLYGGATLTGKLGYEFNGLQLPLQVMAFLWWISVIADALLLKLLSRKAEKKDYFLPSIVMNTFSFLFLYFFVINSR